MKAKLLAIMAVLAMAFAGVAVLADSPATDAADVEAMEISVNTTSIEKFLDEGDTDDTNIVLTVKTAAKATADDGDTVTLKATIPTGVELYDGSDKIEGTFTITIAKGSNSAEETLTVKPTAVLASGTLSIEDNTKSTVKVDIAVKTKAPYAVAYDAVNYGSGAVADQTLFTLYGNAGQAITVTAPSETDPYAITVGGESGVFTIGTNGSVNATVSYTPVKDDKIVPLYEDVAFDFDNGITLTDAVDIYTYAAHADAKIIAYSADTANLNLASKQIQVIWYDDGTALMNLSNVPNIEKVSHVKVTIANSGTDDSSEFRVAAQKMVWIDGAGVFVADNAETPSFADIKISVEGVEDSSVAAYAELAVNAFKLILDANQFNGDAGKFADNNTTITLPYTPLGDDLGLGGILKKGTILTEDNITSMTPINEGYTFLGYSFDEDNKDAIALDAATIEDLVFAYGIGLAAPDANKVFAVWEVTVFNVYLGYTANFIINEGKTPAVGSAGFVVADYIAGVTKDTGAITIKAPSVATAKDLILVRASQTEALASAATAYTYGIKVFVANADGTVGTEVTNVELVMLANGIWTVKGITSDVFVCVTADTSTIRTGFELQMESVVNTSGVGKAVATFNVNDITLADDASLSMAGTFFKTVGGQKVYGDLSILTASDLTYTSAKNYVAGGEIVGGKLKLDNSAVDFALTMDGKAADDAIGFYAIKAVFTITGSTVVESPYALGEVSA